MRDQLLALSKLADMDASAREYDKELEAIPVRINEMRSGVQTLETLLSQERLQLEEARRLHTEQEADLRGRADALARARGKVGRATNLREADLAEREVDTVRQMIRDRESELERIQSTIEAKQTSLSRREVEYEEARDLFTAEEKQAMERLDELRALRDTALEGRGDVAVKVGKALMKRYDRIRTKRDPAVVIIDTNTCSGCRVSFPAQMFIEIQKCEEIFDCPGCRRIFVHRAIVE